jgi:hypothetical protein
MNALHIYITAILIFRLLFDYILNPEGMGLRIIDIFGRFINNCKLGSYVIVHDFFLATRIYSAILMTIKP